MLNLTAAEIEVRKKVLEQNAAQLLGRMLFTFSRLDMNLGLMLAWHFRNSEGRLKDLDDVNFNARLQLLGKHIEGSCSLSDRAKADLSAWLAEAHLAREQRNQLVHGRWAVDPLKDCAVNILGLPSSSGQRAIEYSLAELEAYNQRIERLTSSLSQLRERWQLA